MASPNALSQLVDSNCLITKFYQHHSTGGLSRELMRFNSCPNLSSYPSHGGVNLIVGKKSDIPGIFPQADTYTATRRTVPLLHISKPFSFCIRLRNLVISHLDPPIRKTVVKPFADTLPPLVSRWPIVCMSLVS